MAEVENNEDVLKELKGLQPLDWGQVCNFAYDRGLKPRSVLAVAVRNGLEYRKKRYAAKDGSVPTKKSQLISDIANQLGVEPQEFSGLEKAGKQALITLLANLSE